MKIRTGFVTNSSSTNFLVLSKEELTEDFLFKKLGFVEGGVLEQHGRALCEDLVRAADGRLRYYDYTVPTYETIKEVFGEKSANAFAQREGFHAYWGYTNSDDATMTSFFTMDSFEIDEKDFYLNGRACVW